MLDLERMRSAIHPLVNDQPVLAADPFMELSRRRGRPRSKLDGERVVVQEYNP
jgi:hypothetical protein